MDRQWLKNLALSSFDNGRWNLADPNSPVSMASERVQESLNILFEKVRGNIDVFNLHAPAYKQLKLFKLIKNANTGDLGFVLLLGPLQMQLEQSGAQYTTTGVLFKNPQSVRIPMRHFEAHFDTFGEVFWTMDKKTVVDLERLAKQLLEDICRLAYETKVF